LVDQFSANGSGTVFTLSAAPANTASIIVAVSGVLQDPSTYSVSGLTLTFSAAPPAGTGNISVRFLGIPASGVTTTAYRTLTEFTATAGQTTFSVPSYTAGYIDVYRNGALLGSADFTATNGTTVVLTNAASSGDLVETVSFYVSSVLNAIPATAGAVTTSYLLDASVTQAKLAAGVAGNGPAFSAYANTDQTGVLSGVSTKVLFATEEFDTNSNYASSRFTPTVAGYYQITARTDWSITSGACFITIYKNGTAYKGGALNGATGSGTGPTATGLVYCNGSTDYIEIYAYQNNGTNTIFGSSNSSYTFFQGAMVRAA
jgi:hypothetical protein